MNIETLRIWTSRVLLGFVLITIGFALGRRTAPLPPDTIADGLAAEAGEQPEKQDQVIVYAAHMTFRCPECNQIEWFARELVESEFADALADGRLVLRTVNYQTDTAFALRYDVSSSTLVVVSLVGGEERHFQRLDEVWAKVRNRDKYFDYVRAAIHKSLEQGAGS